MLTGIGSLAAFAVATRLGETLEDRFANRADTKAAMARFREAAAGITDVEALLKDRRTLTVVLEAFQLEGEIDKRGIIRKILTENPDEPGTLANRLTDRRWRELARAFATSQASVLTTTEIAALSTTAVRALTAQQMAGLTGEQVAALTTTQVAALDTRQVAALDRAAIASMEAEDVTALSAAQVAALTPEQLAEMNALQLRGIDSSDIAALTTTQIASLSTTQLSLLRPAQIGALTTAQTAALSFGQAQALDSGQLAALSDAARASISTAAPPPGSDPPTTPPRALMAEPELIERLVRDATTNGYEKAMGEANGGLREALYFLRNAGRVTRVEELMSDRALTTVVRGALGLPESFGVLDFDQQRAILDRRLDFTTLSDPKEVEKLARRYLALAAPQTTSGNPLLTLYGGGGGGIGGLAALVGSTLSLRA
jgi:hypothetical protein